MPGGRGKDKKGGMPLKGLRIHFKNPEGLILSKKDFIFFM
jgi:hypothetical protein